MHFDVKSRTILYVRHGSHAYGLNVATSDEDFKGVCIEPKACHLGFLMTFEQHEHMGSKSDGVDSVVYSLKKLAKLAADCNPSIIEILHVGAESILFIDEFGEELRSHASEFLSKKAKHTFSGYANAQLKRIKTHRSWLLDPPKAPPSRKEFGLSETSKVSASELGAFEASVKEGIEIELPKNLLTLFTREKQYQAAKQQFDQYVNWTKTRNPARAALEAKHGFDTKHGMHLMRLETMALEIMRDHVVYVDRRARGDRDFFLGIRNGQMKYEELIERAAALEAQCDELYKTSTLRKEPDRVALDALVVDITDRYLRRYG